MGSELEVFVSFLLSVLFFLEFWAWRLTVRWPWPTEGCPFQSFEALDIGCWCFGALYLLQPSGTGYLRFYDGSLPTQLVLHATAVATIPCIDPCDDRPIA